MPWSDLNQIQKTRSENDTIKKYRSKAMKMRWSHLNGNNNDIQIPWISLSLELLRER